MKKALAVVWLLLMKEGIVVCYLYWNLRKTVVITGKKYGQGRGGVGDLQSIFSVCVEEKNSIQ